MYSDTSGDLTVGSVGGCKNTHTITDSALRMGFATGIKTKPEIVPVIDEFIQKTFVGEHAAFSMEELLTDGDRSNYATPAFKSMLANHQVKHLLITPHSASQAGRIERAQGSADSKALAALDYAKLGPEWYVSAYCHAINVSNLTSHSALDFSIPMGKSTQKDWFHRYLYLRVFGCPAYVTIPTRYRTKHQTKAWKGIITLV